VSDEQGGSERLASLFEETGYQAIADVKQADIIVLNTCVVRQNAEDRAVNKLQNFKPLKKARPGMIIAVTGCWVESNTDRLKADFPFVDYFFKAGECPPWMDKDKWSQALPEKPQPATYVPIIHGCNNFCAYCVVPYRRGREKKPFHGRHRLRGQRTFEPRYQRSHAFRAERRFLRS